VHLDVKGSSWNAIVDILKEALLPTALLWLIKFVPQNGKLARSLYGKKQMSRCKVIANRYVDMDLLQQKPPRRTR
jgi:hypothetical protein